MTPICMTPACASPMYDESCTHTAGAMPLIHRFWLQSRVVVWQHAVQAWDVVPIPSHSRHLEQQESPCKQQCTTLPWPCSKFPCHSRPVKHTDEHLHFLLGSSPLLTIYWRRLCMSPPSSPSSCRAPRGLHAWRHWIAGARCVQRGPTRALSPLPTATSTSRP